MVKTIRNDFCKLADAQKAKILSSFFKTGPGQYGEGDRFLGIPVPKIRAFAKTCCALSLDDLQTILRSPFHEERVLALVTLTEQFKTGDGPARQAIFDFFLANTTSINNWDLVDITVPHIIGGHLFDKSRAVLHRLAKSKNMWERRIAIVATFYFIRRHQFHDTLKIAETLLEDKEDLIRKAVGWMLREVGKRDEKVLEEFLNAHVQRVSRTTLRYAIERFPEKKRKAFLQWKV
jgi:3-methyladenine DNA glycosylase AlkD